MDVITAIVLALAIGAGAFIISSARISLPLRMKLRIKQQGEIGPFRKWLSDLANCPFCVSVWLSLAATAIYRPWLVSLTRGGYILSFVATALAISATSMLPVLVIKKATEMERRFVNASSSQAK